MPPRSSLYCPYPHNFITKQSNQKHTQDFSSFYSFVFGHDIYIHLDISTFKQDLLHNGLANALHLVEPGTLLGG